MVNSLSKKSNTSKPVKKRRWAIALVLLFILLVGFGFFTPTGLSGRGAGAFPAGEFHIRVENSKGNPVAGATLSVVDGKTKDFAYEYPIDNYFSENDLISNEQGVIIALHKPRGFEFGGACMEYFWLFERCSSGAPKYNGRISAVSYKTFNFSINELLFKSANETTKQGMTSLLLENGETIEIPVYEIILTLQEK